MTVEELREILSYFDPEAIVKVATGSRNGLTIVENIANFTTSTEEVYGKEVVLRTK